MNTEVFNLNIVIKFWHGQQVHHRFELFTLHVGRASKFFQWRATFYGQFLILDTCGSHIDVAKMLKIYQRKSFFFAFTLWKVFCSSILCNEWMHRIKSRRSFKQYRTLVGAPRSGSAIWVPGNSFTHLSSTTLYSNSGNECIKSFPTLLQQAVSAMIMKTGSRLNHLSD